MAKKLSKEHKQKISQSIIEWYRSNPKQIELRRKEAYYTIAGYNKGKHFSKEHKEKISLAIMGKKFPEEDYPNHGMRNKNHSKETKEILSEKVKLMFENGVLNVSGVNNPAWQGGISFEPYGIEFDSELKKQIRERDNHICQWCGEPENGRALDVHHVDFDKKNNKKENLVSLCRSCHRIIQSTGIMDYKWWQ